MLKIPKVWKYYGVKLGENLDFFKKIKTALLYFSIYSKKCPNFRSIGFKGPVLIFVDLIFWQKGSYCGLYRFWGEKKVKKRSFLTGLMVLWFWLKNHICWFQRRTGWILVNRHHLKDLRQLKHLQQPQIYGQVVDFVFFVNENTRWRGKAWWIFM